MEVLQRTANRGSISTGPYEVDNSCKFEADNNESLTKSAATGGDRKKATLSLWFKRTELTGSQMTILFLTGVNGNKYTSLGWGTGDEINFHYYNAGSYPYNFLTDREFRDMSAWYHIVVAVDTTQGTAANRVKFYVNGVQETSFSTEVYPTQNIDTPFNNDSATYPMEIGNDTVFSMGGQPIAGYLADYYLIDGQQLAPTEFGEFDEDSGIWKPKKYSGTISSPSHFLEFKDGSDLGTATSGLDSDYQNNLTAADQSTDTPTNNFATFNTLYDYDDVVINEGATKTTNENTANFRSVVSNIAVQNGKWYAEFTAGSNTGFVGVGLVEEMTGSLPKTQYLGQLGESISYYAYQGQILHGGSAQSTTGTFAGYGAGDVIGIALDKTNGFVYWHKNGTYQNSGDPTSGATGTGGIALSLGYSGYAQSDYYFMGYAQSSAAAAYANFGGYTADTPSSAASDANGYGTFEYAPPTGYYALCTKNLAEYG